MAAAAAYFQPAGRSLLRLKRASGQLGVAVTLRSGSTARKGHVGSLSMTLGAVAPPKGRRLAAACTSLPVQVIIVTRLYQFVPPASEVAPSVERGGFFVKQV